MISNKTVEVEESPQRSFLTSEKYHWQTSPSYRTEVDCTTAKFEEICDVLLCQPQLNSSHLFRADILYDSTGVLKTPAQKEAAARIRGDQHPQTKDQQGEEEVKMWSVPISPERISPRGMHHTRTVVRRLIPRKPKLDRPLEQTCFIFADDGNRAGQEQRLVVYRPHAEIITGVPWYHPAVGALAFSFCHQEDKHCLSIHFLPFEESSDNSSDRLHRTMLQLLNTWVRLLKQQRTQEDQNRHNVIKESVVNPLGGLLETPQNDRLSTDATDISLLPSSLKDTIVPQHLIQNTYTRLKETYASDLISRWVEKTDPSKHVFEDLSIAAFLIELWKQMYQPPIEFPGFTDIACGNGVLVYILLKEGYRGWGIDARRRKTWAMLDIDEHLHEGLFVPKPFFDRLDSDIRSRLPKSVHFGQFPGVTTFVISNHADELTAWTPLFAYFTAPVSPNPFLIIPCCSHALSGARHRYSTKDLIITDPDAEQPGSGDLKALRAAKKVVATDPGGQTDKSTYGCLTRKVAALALEVGCAVELTLMRIPSTRNIGIVGNRTRVDLSYPPEPWDGRTARSDKKVNIQEIISRECAMSGGIDAAAKTWVERALKLQTGNRQRGKVNEKRYERGLPEDTMVV